MFPRQLTTPFEYVKPTHIVRKSSPTEQEFLGTIGQVQRGSSRDRDSPKGSFTTWEMKRDGDSERRKLGMTLSEIGRLQISESEPDTTNDL